MKPPVTGWRLTLALALTLAAIAPASAFAQQLATRFSCSTATNSDGEPAIYSDQGEVRLNGDRIEAFRWESALYRPTHGFDCSIDDSDGLQAELMQGSSGDAWRISLLDAAAARNARGYDFNRGLNCSIRLLRSGDSLMVQPSCPALCGSRTNFTALTVDLKTGVCHYDQ